MLLHALSIISKTSVYSNWNYSPETPNAGETQRFFVPCHLEIWRMTLKNNRIPLLCYFKLCALYHSHWSIQTGVTVWKAKFGLEIWQMTSKNNRAHLLCYFRLCASFHSHQSIQIGSYSPETQNSGENRHFFFLRDLEIWRMTLKNNRAPHLNYFKFCASFHNHRSI